MRTGSRGLSSGSNTPTPFRLLFFCLPRGPQIAIREKGATTSACLPLRALRLPKPPRAAALLLLLSVTCRCHTPLCPHLLTATPYELGRNPPLNRTSSSSRDSPTPLGAHEGAAHARTAPPRRPARPRWRAGGGGACADAVHRSRRGDGLSGWWRNYTCPSPRPLPPSFLSLGPVFPHSVRTIGQPRIGILV